MFKFLDNKLSGIIGDTLKEELQKGTKLSIISAYFTIHAFNQLKNELKKEIIIGWSADFLIFINKSFYKPSWNINPFSKGFQNL